MRRHHLPLILGLILIHLCASAALAALDRPDPSTMSTAEVTALQRQLIDAKCYSGPIDGNLNANFNKAILFCPDMRPIIRVETGMHTTAIRDLSVDPQCKFGVSVAHDKTIRLWDMQDGKLIRVQRLPSDRDGIGGVVNASAMSADGSIIAVGGIDANLDPKLGNNTLETRNAIYVFDRETGFNIKRFGGIENSIKAIDFSPNGTKIAVGIGAGNGIKIFDVRTGQLILSRRTTDNQDIYGLKFGPDGYLYSLSTGGDFEKFDSSLKLVKSVRIKDKDRPLMLSIDPTGGFVAISFSGSLNIKLYDAKSLQFKKSLYTQDLKGGSLDVVDWSTDGSKIYAGGQHYDQAYQRIVRIWQAADGTVIKDIPTSSNAIYSLARCSQEMAFATAKPSFGLVEKAGTVKSIESHASSMKKNSDDKFTVSDDGKVVSFDLGEGDSDKVVFDLNYFVLGVNLRKDQIVKPVYTANEIKSSWLYKNKPIVFGRSIDLQQFETARSLAIYRNKTASVLGTDYKLAKYNIAGIEIWSRSQSTVYGVNLASNDNIIVAAIADGTIRWFRAMDGKELLALFVNKDTRAWVAWTPTGYYTASPGGEDMIGWHVNRGWEQPADFFPASKFRDQYARPDIVERVLDTLDETEAVKQANAAAGRRAEARPIAEILPPIVTILSPTTGSTVEGDSVRLDYLVRSPSGLPVDGIEALVDGRPPGTERGLGRADETQAAVRDCLTNTRGLGRVGDGLGGCRGSLTLRLPPGTSEVGLFARTGARAGDVVTVRLTRSTEATGEERAKPRLFALVVGISAYERPDYALGYAAKDAADFAAALANQQGGLYGEVTLRTLADGKATASAVRDGLDWLRHQVTSRDVGLIYLAGHGLLDDRDRFYFLAADSDAERLRATAVPREDIQDALDGLAGKALLFLDSCHSGAVATKRGKSLNINAVANEFASSERGVVAFTASTGRQVSQENAVWGNGAFTKAVIEALGTSGAKAKGDLLGTGQITTSALDLYVSNRVKGLTSGEQSPIMIRPPTVPDFALATAR